jgi:two-component system, NtrC family, sensor kinase
VRLTWKLTLGVLLGVLVALALNLTLRIERERAAFQKDMRTAQALLAAFVTADVVDEWRENGKSAGLAVVERRAALPAADQAADLQVRAVEVAELSHSDRARLAARQVIQRDEGEKANARLVTLAPVLDREALVLALELSVSLAPVDTYLRTTLLRSVVTLAGVLVVALVLVLALGFFVVGRRVEMLVDKARRTGAGDLGGPLVVRGGDELATLAAALNQMCTQLQEAHHARDTAARAELQALERLRHVDRLSTVGTLAAGIAHELGTPLNVVAGRAQLIVDDAADPARSQRNATIVVEQAARMTRIVRQLLDFARQRKAEKVPVDLRTFLPHIAELLGMLARQSDVELVVALPADLDLGLCADPGQLEQALVNLTVNAVQASPAGGRVTLSAAPHDDVEVPAEHGGGRRAEIWITVADQGPGMDPETVALLFTPFFTTKGVGEGTGLGLAISWGLVQEHSGTIEVDATPGQGSRFTVRLPATPTPTANKERG